MQQVADWLEKLGLAQYAQRFISILRYVLGTVALYGVLVVAIALLVAAFVWLVPLSMRLLLRS